VKAAPRVAQTRSTPYRRQFALRGALLLASLGLAISTLAVTPAASAAARSRLAASYTGATTIATAGAISVLDRRYGLTGDANVDADATNAFALAISDALRSTLRFANGPSGGPQAVVYVPEGSYRLNGLALPSNVRLEIDAKAVLEPIVKPRAFTAADPIQLIQLGTHDKANQIKNVSIVGVNTGTSTLKERAAPLYNNQDISGYFTVDLDPVDSGASNDYAFATLINVQDFLISGLYVIQNNTIPSCTKADATCPVTRGPYPMPTTARAAVVYKPSNQSGLPPGPFYDPTNGTLANMYTIHAPYGFGPTQIASGHNLTFTDLFSDGGTTLRLETDDTNKYYGGEVKTVSARGIVGKNCNRPLSLSAHKQANSDVHVSDVSSVNCNDGLVQSADNATSSGTFLNSTIDGFTVIGGATAQIPISGTNGGWNVGTSTRPVSVTPGSLSWSANVGHFSCSGAFTLKSNAFVLDGVRQSPRCTK